MAEPAAEAPTRLTRKERQAKTRADLLEAAAEVFVRRGFAGASVEEICAEAGYTRGAFYSNFASKEQMFTELLQGKIYEDYQRILRDTPEDLPPGDQLRINARKSAELQSQEEGRWRFQLWLECLALASRDREFAQFAATGWRANRSLVADKVERMYATRGEEPPISPRHIASALAAIDIGLAIQHLVDPEDAPLEVVPQIYGLLFGPMFEGPEAP